MSERKKNIYMIWDDIGANDGSEVAVDEFVAVESEVLGDGDRFGMTPPRNDVRTVKNRPIYRQLLMSHSENMITHENKAKIHCITIWTIFLHRL